jgi:two-component system OmpR family sensor kinase
MNKSWLNRIKRFFVPLSLRYQLLSRSLFILAGLLLLIGLFQYVLMHDFIYKNKATSMKEAINKFPHDRWEQSDGNNTNNNSDRRPPPFIQESPIAFIDLNGKFSALSGAENVTPPQLTTEEYKKALAQSIKDLQQNRDPEHLFDKLNYFVRDDVNGEEQLILLAPIVNHGHLIGLAQVNSNIKPLKEVLFRQLFTFLALSIVALVLGLLAFLPVLKKTLVPLSNLVDTVEQIDGGNLTERFPDHQGQLEIDRLSVSFNGMLERLELSFEAEIEAKEQMRRFIADASHELRTPLTSIHGFLEVLLRGAANNPDQLQKALKSMYGESERVNKLVEDLLLLAKLDRTPHIELTCGDLDDVINEMEPQLRVLAGKRAVSFSISSDMLCMYNIDKMKQVILNLYYNAVQHTDPETGKIEISLFPSSGGVQLAIQDNGFGINKEHLPYLFDRFYRSDSSRTRKYGGAGLGLSITKSIVEVHNGTIRVESKEGFGSTFYVWLPAIEQ